MTEPIRPFRNWVLIGRGDDTQAAALAARRRYFPTPRERERAAVELGRPLPMNAWAVRLRATEPEINRLIEQERTLLCALTIA